MAIYNSKGRLSLATSLGSDEGEGGYVKPRGSERLWKPIKAGKEYTTTTYGLLKLLIMGMSVAGFISLLITVDGQVENGRYSCYLASTVLTLMSYLLLFAMNRLRAFDPRKPSLPHQIERLNGLIFALWNFISSGLVTPVPKADEIPSAPTMEQIPLHCHAGIPLEVIGFLLSATITVNFFLAVWWGPPLRYSLRFKNLTEGEKYENFADEVDNDQS